MSNKNLWIFKAYFKNTDSILFQEFRNNQSKYKKISNAKSILCLVKVNHKIQTKNFKSKKFINQKIQKLKFSEDSLQRKIKLNLWLNKKEKSNLWKNFAAFWFKNNLNQALVDK